MYYYYYYYYYYYTTTNTITTTTTTTDNNTVLLLLLLPQHCDQRRTLKTQKPRLPTANTKRNEIYHCSQLSTSWPHVPGRPCTGLGSPSLVEGLSAACGLIRQPVTYIQLPYPIQARACLVGGVLRVGSQLSFPFLGLIDDRSTTASGAHIHQRTQERQT